MTEIILMIKRGMKTMQTDLITELEKQKDRAIYVVGAFADQDWKKEARAAVRILCRTGDDFTGDDVWRLLAGVSASTPEPRALGAIIKEAAKDGLIHATGEYRKSIRKESHRRPLQVWRPIAYKHRFLEMAG
jgi:hypothetical protein